MADGAVKQVGDREYTVYRLEDLAEEIDGARSRLGELLGARLDAARDALADWRGPHAETFVERANDVLSDMVALRLAMREAARRCRLFPEEPVSTGSTADQYEYMGARLYPPTDGADDVRAETEQLHGYVDVAGEQDGSLAGLAAEVTIDNEAAPLTAEVSVQRGLTSEERDEKREEWEDTGLNGPTLENELDTMRVWGEPEEVDVSEVFGLPDLTGDAEALKSKSQDLSIWVTAVAVAIEDADDPQDDPVLNLLAEHPEVAGFLDQDASTDGQMNGEAALAIVLENIDELDTAAGRGDADDEVGLPDLEAVAGDPDQPEHLREAAQYLLDNRLLLSQLSIVNEPVAYEGDPEADQFTAEDIETFLEHNEALRAIALHRDQLDVANEQDDDYDGYVSVDDLEAVAEDESAPDDLRDAAQYLLDHGELTQRLFHYEDANFERSVGGPTSPPDMTYEMSDPSDRDTPPELVYNVQGFNLDGVIALAVDQQAFGSDPAAAHQFVNSLPVADEDGTSGLRLSLTSNEGVQALANSALLDVQDDLAGQHEVIAQLPETEGGVRNTLINGFYNMLAERTDAVFAGPELAGHPDLPGHPGASWTTFGVWASYGAGRGITGEATFHGITTSDVQQAAADGNQWIFNDVGVRFVELVELYEDNPHPSEAELERFFRNTFDEGDGTIQTAFAAYVAAMEETDPVRRQQLMFQGNSLVGFHEQAGIHRFLDSMTPGSALDGMVVGELALQIGDAELPLGDDVPERAGTNNNVTGQLSSVDEITAGRFGGFQVGGDSEGVVNLEDIAGIEEFQPDLTQSIQEVLDEGGSPNPDGSLDGSGASSWQDWDERMNYIIRLFEQYHTDPDLFAPTEFIDVGFDDVGWLDPAARPGG